MSTGRDTGHDIRADADEGSLGGDDVVELRVPDATATCSARGTGREPPVVVVTTNTRRTSGRRYQWHNDHPAEEAAADALGESSAECGE